MRGDLLRKLGRTAEARAEFLRAASLTQNKREHNLLINRATASRGRWPTGSDLRWAACLESPY